MLSLGKFTQSTIFSQEDVFRLIAPYEICALGGGAVSGPREDGSPAVLICPDPNSGYGCRIITRVKGQSVWSSSGCLT